MSGRLGKEGGSEVPEPVDPFPGWNAEESDALRNALDGLIAVSVYEEQCRIPSRESPAHRIEASSIVIDALIKLLLDNKLATGEQIQHAIAYRAEQRLIERRSQYPNIDFIPGGRPR